MASGIRKGWGHSRWIYVDESWKSAHPCFTVIRNPWSRLVSQFRFGRKLMTEQKVTKNGSGWQLHWSFSEWVSFLDSNKNNPLFLSTNSHSTTQNIQTQKSYVVNEAGIPVVDVLRFENFNEDTMAYLNLSEPLRPRNVTEKIHHDYKSYYNDDTIEWVKNHFKEDIEHFGFSFDSGATKNYFYERRSLNNGEVQPI